MQITLFFCCNDIKTYYLKSDPQSQYFVINYDYFYRAHDHWAWIPPIACSLGGITGAYLYIFTVEIHREPDRLDNNGDTNNERIAMENNQVHN